MWRVLAGEDPLSVPGVFLLHPSLCPSTSKSPRSSRPDLTPAQGQKSANNKTLTKWTKGNAEKIILPSFITTKNNERLERPDLGQP